MSQNIRVSASAVIVQDGALLLVEFDDETGLHYNLPGGGVEPGETLAEAVHREVHEETCAVITLGRLLLVRDYEPNRLGAVYGRRHKLNMVFAATLLKGSQAAMPDRPDTHQTGVRWIPLKELTTVNLVSTTLAEQILTALATPDSTAPTYVTEQG